MAIRLIVIAGISVAVVFGMYLLGKCMDKGNGEASSKQGD